MRIPPSIWLRKKKNSGNTQEVLGAVDEAF